MLTCGGGHNESHNTVWAMLHFQVPGMWTKCAYPSLKPLGSWVKDFHRRITFFNSWLVKGQPACFWLSGFYYPQVNLKIQEEMLNFPKQA